MEWRRLAGGVAGIALLQGPALHCADPPPPAPSLAHADALFGNGQWNAAAAEYLAFVQRFPGAQETGRALLQLGESLQNAGNASGARTYYQHILGNSRDEQVVKLAAVHLGDLEFQEHHYEEALQSYRRATEQPGDSPPQRKAEYLSAICLQNLNREFEARTAFQKIANTPGHPFREHGSLNLAFLLHADARNREALSLSRSLAEKAVNRPVRARAAIALWEWGDLPSARKTLSAVLSEEQDPRWREAIIGALLRTLKDLGDSEAFLQRLESHAAEIAHPLSRDIQTAQADAHRSLKHYAKALELYQSLKLPGNTDPAVHYGELVCLYHLDAPSFQATADLFLANFEPLEMRTAALLMRAEHLRLRGSPAAALAFFDAAFPSVTTPLRRSDVRLRQALCAIQTRDLQRAVSAFSEVLQSTPQHPHAAEARYWRACVCERLRDSKTAEADYLWLMREHPARPEAPLACWRVALMRSARRDLRGMSEVLGRLLKEQQSLPSAAPPGTPPTESPNQASAHQWIGIAAIERRDFRAAQEHLQLAAQLDPQRYRASNELHLIECAYSLNDPALFFSHATACSAENRVHIPPPMLHWCATHMKEEGQPDKAEQILELLCAGDGAQPRDWMLLGETRNALGKFAGALAALERTLEAEHRPECSAEVMRAYLAKAQATLELGRGEQAHEILTQFLSRHPDPRPRAEAQILLGDLEASRGKWDEALRAFDAVSADPPYGGDAAARALEKKARLQERIGKTKEAADTLNQLLSRFPEYARNRGIR